MAEITIRELEIDDVEQVANLFRKLAEYMAHQEGRAEFSVRAPSIYRDYLLANIGKEGHAVFVAADGEDLVGFVEGNIHEPHPLYRKERYAHIFHLYVRKHWRQAGVGQKLLDAFEVWVRERGLVNLELQVRAKNFMGRGFWHRMGYGEYAIIMTRVLGEG